MKEKSGKNDAFSSRYRQLNTEQRLAVDTIDGPVMVIAGPGTGKTSILTLRIANILLKTDTPANGILAITYTDAGVKAMRAKLIDVIGDRAHDVRIFTFHGFASFLMSEYPDHFIHLTDMKLTTDIEQESMIRSIIAHPEFATLRPSGKPDAYVSNIIRSIDEAKREALSPDMVRIHVKDEIKRIQKDESSISTRGATKGQLKAEAKEAIERCEKTVLFADVYERYEKEKREAMVMDFNDLIVEILVALRTDELFLRLIQERFLYIHVDEHQDTNDAQNFIVSIIAEFFETPNIFIVGDEKQAIYRFQGASVENFMLLRKHWPSMKVISLAKNYRSHQSILDASFGMIEKNYADGEHTDLRIRLSAGDAGDTSRDGASSDQPRPVDIVTGENVSAIEIHLVKELKALAESDPSATVAVIVRRNRDLDRVIRLLETHGVPVSSERSVDIFSHPVGRVFFDLLEYLYDPSHVESLARTMVAGLWGLSLTDSALLTRDMRAGISEGLNRRLPALARIRSKMLSDSPIGFLIHSAHESGFIELVARDPAYVHVWRGIVSLAESLVREGDIHDSAVLAEKMLAYRTSAQSRTVKVSVGAPDVAIQAMTAHGSKGLEFDYVYIPYTTEDSWVGRARGASFVLPKKQVTDADIRDVRRLFYVAITRARKHVMILTALEESDGKTLTPLRCIDELDEAHVARMMLPKVDVDEVYVSQKNENSAKKNSPIVDIAKRVLLDKGLSVTALNHFMKCPNEFIYQSILKLPQAPSIPSEKGNAMHDAISHVWRSEKRDVKTIENIMTERISAFFAESMLAVAEKEVAKRELLEDVPAVARALESHFAVGSAGAGTGVEGAGRKVLTESWVKDEFIGEYEGQKITIPIHGKLDAIIEHDSEVSVFDYKTKLAMSVAAIKGETKSSDGSYFRQLIFYRILIEGDSRYRGKRVLPALVFVSPDEKGRCPIVSLPIEDADMVRVRSEIQALIESVWSGEVAQTRCDDRACEFCGLAGLVDY